MAYKIEISVTAAVGQNLFLPHPYGLIIGANSVIKDNCTIGPWVVVGHNGRHGQAPVIGNNVYIGPHACILGDIKIGDRAFIGANSVVVEDVEPGATVAINIRTYQYQEMI